MAKTSFCISTRHTRMQGIVTTLKYLEEKYGIPLSVWPQSDGNTRVLINPSTSGAFIRYEPSGNSVFVALSEEHRKNLSLTCKYLQDKWEEEFHDCYPMPDIKRMFYGDTING